MEWIRHLFAPLSYLRIRHVRKVKYDFWIPLFAATFTWLALTNLPVPALLLTTGGLLDRVSKLIEVLVGFFIAALAAVATFDRHDMDLPMLGDPPTLRMRQQGIVIIKKLSRRQFLCYLFGYLAFTSIFIYLSTLMLQLSAPSIESDLSLKARMCFRSAGLFVYLFVFWNMIVTTLFGLYYLTERINRDNRESHEKRDSV